MTDIYKVAKYILNKKGKMTMIKTKKDFVVDKNHFKLKKYNIDLIDNQKKYY